MLSIHRGRRLIKVTWNTRAGESFTFYLNDQWGRERDNGDDLAGHAMPLTQEIRVNRIAKLYRPA
jgi:hypothetical protein